jgi:hydrogenase maturation protein HypF
MENLETLEAMERGLAHFRAIFRCEPQRVVCDVHPGYLSTKWAKQFAEKNGLPLLQVQHHYAHVASLMAEHGMDGSEPVLGMSFDGTGYGTDGAIWGGELMVADYRGFERVARLKYVQLPGGDAAVKRPYRMALAHLQAAGIAWDDDLPCVAAAPADERRVLRRQIETGFNCVDTSSMGRLFDAVASLVGVCHVASYEAQAAIELEMASADTSRHTGEDASGNAGDDGYKFDVVETEAPQTTATSAGGTTAGEEAARHEYRKTIHLAGELIIDPAPVLRAVLADLRAHVATGVMAARFHAGLAAMIVEVCTRVAAHGAPRCVGLTGGVFQNVRLVAEAKTRLEGAGFKVLIHRVVPPNDGGLALGQAALGGFRL